jgi:hypothetical protein
MKYNAPYGVSDPNAAYINGDPSTGTMGSIPPAASIEFPQREIVAMIADSGLTPDNAVLNQLALATQTGKINFGVDAGTVNNLQITLNPAPILANGFVVRVLVAHTNTGQSVLNCNATGPLPIQRRGGTPILANDLQINSIATMILNFQLGAWELMGVGGQALGQLTGNKTLYVNYAIGSDANDGTDNTSAHAVKSIQAAISIAFSYMPSQYGITIYIADSPSYAGWGIPYWAGPNLTIIGNVNSPQNVVIDGGNNWACAVGGPNTVTLQGVTAKCNTSGTLLPAGCFSCGSASSFYISKCRSLDCEGAVFEAYNGHMIVGDHTFAGSHCGYLFWGMSNGFIETAQGATYTFAQNPLNLTTANCYATMGGLVQVTPGPVATWVNPSFVFGSRYLSTNGGVIATPGLGINYFPGSVAGSTANGGVYA